MKDVYVQVIVIRKKELSNLESFLLKLSIRPSLCYHACCMRACAMRLARRMTGNVCGTATPAVAVVWPARTPASASADEETAVREVVLPKPMARG